jgi:flagellin-like hook-associated protein FlgL
LRELATDTRADARSPLAFELVGNGQTVAQRSAGVRFGEALSLLNEKAGERYLFSGRAGDRPAVETSGRILDGEGSRAGLRQLIAERLQADQGADMRGRLLAPVAAADIVTLAEDNTHPFGFKIASATTDFGATVTGPLGAPASLQIDLGGVNPPDGGRVSVRLALPDGSTVNIELEATSEVPPPSGTFAIGATADDTAQNLASAIDDSIQALARTDLAAASAMRAGQDFFAIDADSPPQRVDGPPFDSATALVDGTSANTVFWYVGDDAVDNARQTSIARVDDAITIEYGARANEEGIRHTVQSIAVFAAMTFSESDPDARDRYSALLSRLGTALSPPSGVQRLEAIQTEIAGAKLAADAAGERLADRKPVLQGMVDQIEGVPMEEVGAMLLQLNTRFQATLQTTAMLSQFNLLNYL